MGKEEKDRNLTHFLNVDLDLDAADGLDELVEALEPATAISRFGTRAGLELDWQSESPESVIRGFVTLVEKLPPHLRTIWDNAGAKTFDIGIQAGAQPRSVAYVISSDVLSLIHSISADVAFTVYAVRQDPD